MVIRHCSNWEESEHFPVPLSLALGVVIVEVLSGLPVSNPRPGHRSLTLLAEDFWDEEDRLTPLLDSSLSWDRHVVETLSDIASPEVFKCSIHRYLCTHLSH